MTRMPFYVSLHLMMVSRENILISPIQIFSIPVRLIEFLESPIGNVGFQDVTRPTCCYHSWSFILPLGHRLTRMHHGLSMTHMSQNTSALMLVANKTENEVGFTLIQENLDIVVLE